MSIGIFLLAGTSVKFLIAVAGTTVAWLVGIFVTPPEEDEILMAFILKGHPGGPGWKKGKSEADKE